MANITWNSLLSEYQMSIQDVFETHEDYTIFLDKVYLSFWLKASNSRVSLDFEKFFDVKDLKNGSYHVLLNEAWDDYFRNIYASELLEEITNHSPKDLWSCNDISSYIIKHFQDKIFEFNGWMLQMSALDSFQSCIINWPSEGGNNVTDSVTDNSSGNVFSIL